MKILVLTKLYPTLKDITVGIFNRVFIDYFAEHSGKDLNIDIIRAVPFLKEKKVPKIIQKDNLTIHYPLVLSFGRYLLQYHHIFYFKSVLNYIIREEIDFDLIHSHWLYPDCYVAAKIAKYFNKPFISHFHGSDVNFLLYDKRLEKYNRYTLFNSNKIIVVSDALREKLGNKYSEIKDKIEVIYNGVDFIKFNSVCEKDAIDITKISETSFKKIVFVGNVTNKKGIRELLDASKIVLKKRNDFKIYLIGRVKSDEFLLYNKIIEENGLKSVIEIVGTVKNELIKYYYKIADFSVLPSYTEGFPLVVVESLASGKPVIATTVGGIPEILNDKSLGLLIPPKDSKALADAISYYLENSTSKIDLNKIEKFNISVQSNKTLAIYKSLIK